MSPFGSDTGRNQPSNSRYIFGASAWQRSIIKAPADRVLAYIDFSSQEFALGGTLSGDQAMMDDYRSGDPYLAWARRTGAIPPDATKSSHLPPGTWDGEGSLPHLAGGRDGHREPVRSEKDLPAAEGGHHRRVVPDRARARQRATSQPFTSPRSRRCPGWSRSMPRGRMIFTESRRGMPPGGDGRLTHLS